MASFNFNYYYNEIDISDFLRDGENLIAVHCYYQGLINRVWVSGDDRVGLIFELSVDGKTVLQSDETVKCKIHGGYSVIGEVGYATQFVERQDSRCADFGFESVDFDDSRVGLFQKAQIRRL